VTEAGSPQAATNVPDLAQWESQMVSFGNKACAELNAATGESALGATYYDAEKVFLQIAAYFPAEAAKWTACAQRAEAAYRDNYVEKAVGEFGYGAVPGYWVFTDGLRRDFELTGDTRSRAAVENLAKAAAVCIPITPIDWLASASVTREVAYCLNAYLDAEALGFALPSPRANELLTLLLGYIDDIITMRYKTSPEDDVPATCKGKPYAQPFMFGLAMKTLIEWDAVHPDARIQPAVKRAADFMWDKLRYQPVSATQGGRFWYEGCTNPDGAWNVWAQTPGNGPADDLNLLFAPGFAWLYSKGAGEVYRSRGDQIWTVGVTGAWLDGSKQFNQNYYWSFKYVEWRR
jgi:hypothetical protein